MQLEEYRVELLQKVGVSAEANLNFDRSEFVKNVLDSLIESEVLSDFVSCHYEGNAGINGRKVEIDAYNFDEDDNTFSLMVCSFTGTSEMQRISKADVEKVASRAMEFVEAAIDGTLEKNVDESEDAFELAKYIRATHPTVERYRILVLSDASRSDKMDKLVIKELGGKMVVPALWDITNLFDLETSKKGYEVISIDMKEFGTEGIPCLSASASEKGPRYESYLCVIPGTTLAALYERYGSRLLESNVRSFLSTTTKTNRNIRATILNEPDMFFSFNNGITATAMDVTLKECGGRVYVTNMTSLQIVNGGQTTVSIYTAAKKDRPDMSRVFVPMKITIIPPEDAGEIVPRISRSANTQNKVTEADFFSNHPFHVRMETLSRTVLPPLLPGAPYSKRWYYERVRGQYRQDKIIKGKQFELEYPKDQIFTKMELAYYQMCYAEKPFYLIQGWALRELSKEIALKWGTTGVDYNELYFKKSVAMGILYKAINDNVSKQDWYRTGAKIETVAYTFSKFINMIGGADKELDLQRIWNLQKVPNVVVDQLMDIAKAVNASINDDKEEPNVRSWCKKPRCWDKIKNLKVELKPEMENFFIRKGANTWQQKTARKDQTMKNEVDAKIEVVRLGPLYWEKMYDWGVEYQMLDGTEKSILRVAFEKGERSLPSDRQALAILKIRTKLIANGYKP